MVSLALILSTPVVVPVELTCTATEGPIAPLLWAGVPLLTVRPAVVTVSGRVRVSAPAEYLISVRVRVFVLRWAPHDPPATLSELLPLTFTVLAGPK